MSRTNKILFYNILYLPATIFSRTFEKFYKLYNKRFTYFQCGAQIREQQQKKNMEEVGG